MYNLYVVVEYDEIDDSNNYEEGKIISVEPEVGTVLKEGETVTLHIPDMTAEYPDFTSNSYTLKDIEAFAEKYDLDLTINYEETSDYEAGTLISQSREAGSTVINGMSLKIVIATEITEEIEEAIEVVE